VAKVIPQKVSEAKVSYVLYPFDRATTSKAFPEALLNLDILLVKDICAFFYVISKGPNLDIRVISQQAHYPAIKLLHVLRPTNKDILLINRLYSLITFLLKRSVVACCSPCSSVASSYFN
jgi:hypothetical protein